MLRRKTTVHLLTADISEAAGAQPKAVVKNIAAFERQYATYDIVTNLRAELEFNADIVNVAIGEDANESNSEGARTKFAAAFAKLLAAVQARPKTQ